MEVSISKLDLHLLLPSYYGLVSTTMIINGISFNGTYLANYELARRYYQTLSIGVHIGSLFVLPKDKDGKRNLSFIDQNTGIFMTLVES